VKVRKGWLQRSLSQKLVSRQQKDIKSVQLMPVRCGRDEVFIIKHTVKGNSLIANIQPKMKKKQIKEIFVLTTRIGHWPSSKRGC